MTGADDVNAQMVDARETVTVTRETAGTGRREFLRQALVITSGAALSEIVAAPLREAAAQTACPSPGPAFVPVGQITSQDRKLRAVIKVTNGVRNVPTSPTVTTPTMLRFFDGYNPANPNQKWPVAPGAPGPGPTLRCSIGDTVQITLLNQVKVQDFGGSLDSGEEGRGTGCDQSTKVNPDGSTDKNWYPSIDKYPDCLHGSSSANIHFHGTHVTPATTGDNVLVQVRPNAKVTERDVQPAFDKIFAHCGLGHEPQKWGDLPQEWREFQDKLLTEYDQTAPYQGGHGLPPNLRLLPQNQQAIAQGVWPQWYVGSYPYCFQIPVYDGKPTGVKMGQAPGTHWYHSHKHGSTAINLFNGLSGALIITDNRPTGYDGKLQSFYNNNLQEIVLVLQQIMAAPNLLSTVQRGPGATLVNGQFTPTVTMQPGQIQLWRIINSTVQGFVNVQFNSIAPEAPALQFRQIAQDGVQFAWENYTRQNPITLAPANRADLLVQAPLTTGCYVLGTTAAPILYVNVTGTPVSPQMQFPAARRDFPPLPVFLADIPPRAIRLRRQVVYGWEKGRTAPGRNPANAQPPAVPNAPPHYMIDGKQFEDQVIDQVMLLDTAEEWTIVNETAAIAHPFHIHVNPFQVVELFDPTNMDEPLRLKPPFVWWDTFAIPPASNVHPNGTPRINPVTGEQVYVPGYFKMRTRFVDFAGMYVQHCHILAHEDRGMMQLLQVVNNRTIMKHH